jgi:hypothetical protein
VALVGGRTRKGSSPAVDRAGDPGSVRSRNSLWRHSQGTGAFGWQDTRSIENLSEPNGTPKTTPHSAGEHKRAPSPLSVARLTKKLYDTVSPTMGDSMLRAKLTLSLSTLPHANPDARNAPSWNEPLNPVHSPAFGNEEFFATRGGNPRSSTKHRSSAAATVAPQSRSATVTKVIQRRGIGLIQGMERVVRGNDTAYPLPVSTSAASREGSDAIKAGDLSPILTMRSPLDPS